jgi:hypothetical protein
MTNVRRELWQDRAGGLWAIELVGGRVRGCWGPIDVPAHDVRLEDLPYERNLTLARAIERDRHRFVPVRDGEAT